MNPIFLVKSDDSGHIIDIFYSSDHSDELHSGILSDCTQISAYQAARLLAGRSREATGKQFFSPPSFAQCAGDHGNQAPDTSPGHQAPAAPEPSRNNLQLDLFGFLRSWEHAQRCTPEEFILQCYHVTLTDLLVYLIMYGQEGSVIHRIRKASGHTQASFASRYGIPLRTVTEWDCGRREPAPYISAYLAYFTALEADTCGGMLSRYQVNEQNDE